MKGFFLQPLQAIAQLCHFFAAGFLTISVKDDTRLMQEAAEVKRAGEQGLNQLTRERARISTGV